MFPLYSEPSSGLASLGVKGQASSRFLGLALLPGALFSQVATWLPPFFKSVPLLFHQKGLLWLSEYNNISPTPLHCFCFSHPYFIISPLHLLTDLL